MNYEVVREENQIIVVFNEIELLESFTETKYSELLMKLADEDKDIVLDFSEVEVVDSLFIGDLIILHKKLQAMGHKLFFRGLNEFLEDIFEKLNLTDIF
jgi:anti-anti-sigma regulatory factor